jgi:hypothetical protein
MRIFRLSYLKILSFDNFTLPTKAPSIGLKWASKGCPATVTGDGSALNRIFQNFLLKDIIL